MTSRTLALVTAIAGSALLSACMGSPASGGGIAPLTPTSRYTLQVEPGLDRIALAVHDSGLSQAQVDALAALASRALVDGAPEVVIEAPAGGDPAASEQAYRAKAALEAAGAPPVRIAGYAAPDPRAPILAGFETVRAVVPQCGTAWGSQTRTFDNQSSINFGCAVTANLAAQIENPRDIVQPRGMTPGDAGRRTVVIDNYRTGALTGAEREPLLSNQRVARAVD
ncbi:MAG: pilus assembly protein CpaD [Brevundimonas sp.]|nr:MAG: pilus assembly protein CpaD [Brevundimonas sp.]